MLCSNCYKKIPRGKEVEKITGSWRVNYFWKLILCKKCAKKQDKYLFTAVIFLLIYFLVLITIILVINMG